MDTFMRVLIIAVLLGGIYGLVAMGLNLIFGVVRVVNFAHGELVMLGMYGAYFLNQVLGWNVYATMVIVVPAMFVLGLIIQRVVIQPLSGQTTMQLLATFGLVIVFQNSVLAITEGEAYSVSSSFARNTFDLGVAKVDYGRLVVLVATTAVAVALWWLIHKTSFGRSVRAVTEDRMAARLMGINVERTFLIVFGIGSALAGLAGVLLAPVYTLTPNVGQSFIFAAFAVVVVGGLGSVTGAYLGGFLIGLVEAFSGYYIDPRLGMAFYFGVFLLVLIIRPAGLFGRAGSEEMGA
ncbi:branched-chain amino acid ABC transporter permease [Nocardioides psychrotolerans]|uniref:Branched-chain amino acid transport system permease protein n=1 Tax=Nocardioides psychrotolerans TaxID=1005945 RepID=A0A1I3IPZ2_9ACTN|nr:branched-chain amino acid ABC transporter permease [Nocardioides psychrotolerans]GEP38090.1 branched-chain amino acid ABC transporter permease [Nocardioides psychrotolerans]SFI49982.1 branched-chain amino acid transport system permease protein [Nocardioides psychrotolerans]